MVERSPVINKKKIVYEGLFSVQELYTAIEAFQNHHGYTRKDIVGGEFVKKDGRTINQRFELIKQLSEYATSVLHINIKLFNIKDVHVEKEGIKRNLNQGKIEFLLDAYFETDFEHRWENKPGFFFIRILFDKYLFKPFTTDYEGLIAKDFHAFTSEIKAHLHLYKY
ncbi:MAG: hypothetical protein ACMXYE_03885 [Candidatus Woesearchaeota archaeon]